MNKKIIIGIIAVLGVALLAGAAFMGVRLLNAGAPAGEDKSGSPMATQIPAPEMPKQDADLSGLVISVKDNSVFVAQVDNNISVRRLLLQPTPAGPYTEVVVSQDTKVYRDATYDSVPAPSRGLPGSTNQHPLQQVLESIQLSAITAPSYIQVWGERRGDRINASVIVWLRPTFPADGGGN